MNVNSVANLTVGFAGMLAGVLATVDYWTGGALWELAMMLADGWEAANLRRRLAAWWYMVTHRHLMDSPPPVMARCVRCGRILEGLEAATAGGGAWCGDCWAQLGNSLGDARGGGRC